MALWVEGKTPSWVRIATVAAVALTLCIYSTASRADFFDWLTNLVIEDSAELNRSDLPSDAIFTRSDEVRTVKLGRDIVDLSPSTAITIEVSSAKRTVVHLITGTVRAKVAKRKPTQVFQIDTSMLVATVKGTEFEVSRTRDVSAVSVFEGRVALKVRGIQGGVDITPGKTGVVSRGDREALLKDTPEGGAAAVTGAALHPGSSFGSSNNTASPDEPAPSSPPSTTNKPQKPSKTKPSKSKHDKKPKSDSHGVKS